MKTVLRICILIILSFVLYSCSKTDAMVVTNPPPAVPNITSKIYPYTTQPASAALGTGQSVFQEGDIVTLYVPYGVSNDNVVSSTLVITDAGSGDVIKTFTLFPSTDSSAAQLDLPADLRDVPFMFTTFTLDNTFTGKAVNVSTSIIGNTAHSEDVLNNAFSVIP
jgi:hypothetical protein